MVFEQVDDDESKRRRDDNIIHGSPVAAANSAATIVDVWRETLRRNVVEQAAVMMETIG